MAILPQRYDYDGIPVPFYWRYRGEHRVPKTPFLNRSLPLGFLSFVVAAAVSSGVNYMREAPYRGTVTGTQAPSAEPLRVLNSLDGSVYYLDTSAGTPDGRYCVRRPIVADAPNGGLVMAGVGREGSSYITVFVGEPQPKLRANILKATLTWSPELGSFVTSELVEVGEVVPMQPGDNCE